MVDIIFVQSDGTEATVSAVPGVSLMEAARDNGVPGVAAECNGSAACATCHMILPPELAGMAPPMQETEDDLLDFAASERRAGSRLGCQIPVSEHWAGGKIQIPDAPKAPNQDVLGGQTYDTP